MTRALTIASRVDWRRRFGFSGQSARSAAWRPRVFVATVARVFSFAKGRGQRSRRCGPAQVSAPRRA
eukprot:7166794-Lingulodinium_polyedra.AAC.1